MIGAPLKDVRDAASDIMRSAPERNGRDAALPRKDVLLKTLLFVLGLVAVAVGALWTGQGLGFIAWPAESFMIRQTQWAYYGAGLAIIGIVLVALSRRR
jgi:hypothetical protein